MKQIKLPPVCRRMLALFLILSMASAAFCSCGVIILNSDEKTEPPQAATTVPPETTAPDEVSGEATEPITEDPSVTDPEPQTTVKGEPVVFPSGRIEDAQARLDELTDAIDLSGFNIVIAVASDTLNVIFTEEDSPLYAARSNRNTMLYEKYGVDIITIYDSPTDSETMYNELSAAIKTGGGEYYLDLLFLPANGAGKFLAGGLLADMRTLPFYNTREGNMAGNVGNERYFDLGAGTDAPEYIYALYFNRAMVGAEDEKMLYSAALDGTLGFEQLLTVAKNSQAGSHFAVNGGNSVLGEIGADLLGINFVTKSKAGVPKLELSETDIARIDGLVSTLSGFSYAAAEENTSATDIFTSGGSLYYLGMLSEITQLYDDPIEWGLLPLPSEQRLVAISDKCPVICLPKINTRHEQTSLWLSGFNAASGDWIGDQLHALAVRDYMRDNNSCLTLFEILSGDRVIGFEKVFSGYYEGLADATYAAVAEAAKGTAKFSEIYASKLSAINKKLAKLP